MDQNCKTLSYTFDSIARKEDKSQATEEAYVNINKWMRLLFVFAGGLIMRQCIIYASDIRKQTKDDDLVDEGEEK
jgi:hypothetical protein